MKRWGVCISHHSYLKESQLYQLQAQLPIFFKEKHSHLKDCLILIPFRLPQISCFTLSLKCFSSDSDNCPNVGIRPLLQFPHPLRAGPVLLTLLYFPLVPSFYWVLRGSIRPHHWSGTPVHSQLVFCMHFCVWRCIPDVSMERDVLHVHLLLCHL